MKFVDAHVHLSDEEYASCVDQIIADAKNARVVAMVSSSMDLKTCQGSLKLAKSYDGLVYAALGIHPWSVQALTEEEYQQTLQLIEKQKQSRSLIAIGEIGLDFKYTKIWNKQMKVFDEMLHMAERLNLPAIIHSKGTTAQIIDMLPSYKLKRVLLHWFSNPISALAKAVEEGCYITEGPPTLYSNGIRDVVKKVPLTNLLTETDGPVRYFKSPFEGKMTSPTNVPMVVKAIAEIKKLEQAEVAQQIMKNFEDFFGVKLN
jgi:TatD DNase family protein